jgi:hypothetical protein
MTQAAMGAVVTAAGLGLEAWGYRRSGGEANGPTSGESASQLGEDCQVAVKLDSLDAWTHRG